MIELVRFAKEHYDGLISWINNEEELMQFAGPAYTYPLTKRQLDDALKDEKRYAFSVFHKKKNIGHCEIYLKESSIHLGRILIGDANNRGKGIGEEIVNELLDFGFRKFDRTVAELNVFDWNTRAIECYKKVGFSINPGNKMERFINNKVWTTINMKLEKKEWRRKLKNKCKKGNRRPHIRLLSF